MIATAPRATDVDLAPDPAFGAPVLARVPFPFALDLDPGAVHQQVQRTVRAAIRDVYLQGLLPSRQRAEVGHGPVHADQTQQAPDEPGGLAECNPEQHLHRQADLDGVRRENDPPDRFLSLLTAVVRLATTLAGGRGVPGHRRIEPDRQRATAVQRFVIGRPVPGLVARGCRSAHDLSYHAGVTG